MSSEKDAIAIERLNSLLSGELAAIGTYQQALALISSDDVTPAGELMRLALEHRRSANTLRETIVSLGGTPSEVGSPWGSFAKVQPYLDLFSDRANLTALLEGEETGLREYRQLLPSFEPEIHRVLEHELIPRQRKHVAVLSSILLSKLSSESTPKRGTKVWEQEGQEGPSGGEA